MIKPISEMPKGIIINLNEKEGSPMHLLALARKLCKQHYLDEESILADMEMWDNNHLIAVFEEHFSDYVSLYK